MNVDSQIPEAKVPAKDFFRIRIEQFPAHAEGDLTNLAFDHGAAGITEDLPFRQPDLALDPTAIPTKSKHLIVYFENQPPKEFFDGVNVLAPHAAVYQELEPQKDWLSEWKKGFHAFKLVGKFWLVPSWEKSPVDETHTISIDPGMAFGTGTHATTKMMAGLIQKYFDEKGAAGPGEPTFLDVGCGTGILSILARRLGGRDIVGVEIDPIARDVARANFRINAIDDIEVTDLPLEEISGAYDLVGGNIIDGVLLQLKDHLLRLMKPDGELLLSGILADREQPFLEKFIADTDLKVKRRLEHEDWVAFWLSR